MKFFVHPETGALITEEEAAKLSAQEEVKSDIEGTSSEKDEEDGSLIGIFLLSFVGGFAALLTPCVFPMIPMTVSFFTKQSKTRTQGITNAWIYGAFYSRNLHPFGIRDYCNFWRGRTKCTIYKCNIQLSVFRITHRILPSPF